MKKALTSVIVSIAMVSGSVSAIAADIATGSVPVVTNDTASTKSQSDAQTGPLAAGGPSEVVPAQLEGLTISPFFIVGGLAVLGIGIAAAAGAFSTKSTPTTSTQ